MRALVVPSLLTALILAACTADSPPPPQLMTPSVAEGALPLNARRLEIIENWKMPIEPPYIGHLQQPYPGNLISQWAPEFHQLVRIGEVKPVTVRVMNGHALEIPRSRDAHRSTRK